MQMMLISKQVWTDFTLVLFLLFFEEIRNKLNAIFWGEGNNIEKDLKFNVATSHLAFGPFLIIYTKL